MFPADVRSVNAELRLTKSHQRNLGGDIDDSCSVLFLGLLANGEDTIFKVANRNVIFHALDELIASPHTIYLHYRRSFHHMPCDCGIEFRATIYPDNRSESSTRLVLSARLSSETTNRTPYRVL